MRAETRYAASGGVNIAYQVVGDGPRALLFVPGWVSHLDLQWVDPTYARFLRHLASFSRLIMFDKRGVGLSDPVAGAPTLDERMDDIRIVLDAVGIEKASIFALSEGAPVSALFAATHPERVEHLVLYGGFAAGWAVPDAPARADHLRGLAPIYEQLDRGEWGTGASLDVFAPDLASKPAIRKAFGMFERSSVSPGMAREMLTWISQLDVRSVLPLVQAPTLVVHRRGDHVPVEAGRALSEGIPGARFLVLEGNAHAPVSGNVEDVVGAVEEHVTGTRREWAPERILATVAFADLVGSTERAAAIGNRAWHDLVERT